MEGYSSKKSITRVACTTDFKECHPRCVGKLDRWKVDIQLDTHPVSPEGHYISVQHSTRLYLGTLEL